MNVLFVCTGNVCRSPMAEGFLRKEALVRGLNLDVRSTGTHAWEGRAATFDGRRVMTEMDTPIDDQRTRAFTRDLVVDWADLVIGLAREHARDTVRDYPEAAAKTHTLKGLVRLLPSLPDHRDDASWIEAAAEARDASNESDLPLDETDVHDPIGERVSGYRRVAEEIRDLIAILADGLEAKGMQQTA
jgi:protein-tyrosine-phosphatase